jgi:23S rRNA pseudouridine1911/1915/1917 synthase
MNLLEESESIVVFNVKKDDETLEEFSFNQKISGRLFRRLYREKNIFVNKRFIKKNQPLKKGDTISIVMEDEKENTVPEFIPLDIIYEDLDLLVLNKQPFIVVHPTKSYQRNTLSNGISYYFQKKGINKKIRFVNRLDMDTSGVLIVAKSPFAHQQMALQFEKNQVEKRYIAIVSGVVKNDEDIIDLPIGREEENSIRKVVTKEGKNAITKYKVIKRFKDATILDVQIFTGRSHQIRVHLNHVGHPIIGDTLYYRPSKHINRQALHSYYLKAKSPRSKKQINFKASLPDDIKNLINILKRN